MVSTLHRSATMSYLEAFVNPCFWSELLPHAPVHLCNEHSALAAVSPPADEVDHVVVEDHGVVRPRPRHPAHLPPSLLLRAELEEGVEDLVVVETLPVVKTSGDEDPFSSLHRRVLTSTSSRQPWAHAPGVRLSAVAEDNEVWIEKI